MRNLRAWAALVMLTACTGSTEPAEATTTTTPPTPPPTSTLEALGATSRWYFGPGVMELDVTLSGGPAWDFDLEGILFFGVVELYPATTCTLTGQDFRCEQSDFYDKLIDIEGTFDSDFQAGTVIVSVDGPDTGFGDLGPDALEGERL